VTVAGDEARSCASATRYKKSVAGCALSRHSRPICAVLTF